MAFAIIYIERGKEDSVRATLSDIGFEVWPGVMYGREQDQIGCPIESVEQLDWIQMCPGVLRVQSN